MVSRKGSHSRQVAVLWIFQGSKRLVFNALMEPRNCLRPEPLLGNPGEVQEDKRTAYWVEQARRTCSCDRLCRHDLTTAEFWVKRFACFERRRDSLKRNWRKRLISIIISLGRLSVGTWKYLLRLCSKLPERLECACGILWPMCRTSVRETANDG